MLMVGAAFAARVQQGGISAWMGNIAVGVRKCWLPAVQLVGLGSESGYVCLRNHISWPTRWGSPRFM
jgi:hypothetical protein